MITRFPRTVYRPLPEGRDYMIAPIDGDDEVVIVINEALDEEGRRVARKAARADYRQEHGWQGWLVLPFLAAGEWLRRRAQSPIGAAALAGVASVATGAAVYVITADDPPPPVATPPIVITTIAPPTAASTASPTPTMERASPAPAREPGSDPPGGGEPAAQPARTEAEISQSTVPRARPAAPTRRAAGTPPPREDDGPPITSITAPADPAPAVTPPPEPGPEPPVAGPAPDPAPEADDPPPAAEPASQGCDGIGLRVRLDPLADVGACLLG